MKRLIAIFALLAMVLAVAVAQASPNAATLPPIVLTPGDTQPITCQYGLVGSLSSPTCPSPTATALPLVLTENLGAYQEVKVTCASGDIPQDLGPTGNAVYVLCPAVSPTSTVTPTPTP